MDKSFVPTHDHKPTGEIQQKEGTPEIPSHHHCIKCGKLMVKSADTTCYPCKEKERKEKQHLEYGRFYAFGRNKD